MRRSIITFLVAGFMALGGTAFAVDSEGVGPWVKDSEKDGVVGYSRTNPRTSCKEFKAVGVIDAAVPVVERILRDAEAETEYMFMVNEAYRLELPGREPTADSYYTYLRQGLPWPINDRDGVGKIDFYYDKASGEMFVTGLMVESEYKKGDSGLVRMPVGDVKWYLKPVDEGRKTELTYQNLADPGGNLPSDLVNWLLKRLGVYTINDIRKLAKLEKYQATEVITTTPWIREK